MQDAEPWIAHWPGKSPAVEGGLPHPAAYHMLDVAAVAERLLASETHLPPPVRDALAMLVGLHDLGKIGDRHRLFGGRSRRHLPRPAL